MYNISVAYKISIYYLWNNKKIYDQHKEMI